MDSRTIGDLSSYVNWIEMPRRSTLTLFRGQAVARNLLPSIARKIPTYDSTSMERQLLDQFKLLGASLLTDIKQGSLELLVIAQHYGLATRLLDWTANPLAALYFACADTPETGDTYVYALEADDLVSRDAYETTDPFAASKTRVIQPPLNNPRIVAQQGWFTLHMYSADSKRFVALEKNREIKSALTEVVIPSEHRRALLESLIRHGIGSQTLFPDLIGLCRHLNREHVLSRDPAGSRW